MLQIEAFSVSPFVLGFLYVFTQISVKRAPLCLRDVRSRILPGRWNCDYGRIADASPTLSGTPTPPQTVRFASARQAPSEILMSRSPVLPRTVKISRSSRRRQSQPRSSMIPIIRADNTHQSLLERSVLMAAALHPQLRMRPGSRSCDLDGMAWHRPAVPVSHLDRA